MVRKNDFQELVGGIFAVIILILFIGVFLQSFPEVNEVNNFISFIIGFSVFVIIVALIAKLVDLLNKIF